MYKFLRRISNTKDTSYLFWGLFKKYRLIKLYALKYCLPILRRRLQRELFDKNLEVDDFKERFTIVLGDFSDFNQFVSDIARSDILEKADEILTGVYNILGSGKSNLKPINWHLDFKSGYIWPKGKYFLHYKQIDNNNDSDVKVPRELSRSHHLLTLGQAYLLTKNEKFAEEYVNQVEGWITENPFMRSINWGCAMDVAIRAVNWIFSLNMIMQAKIIDERFLKKIFMSLYEHGYYVFNNLEKKFKDSNNHYFSNLAGLIYLGLLFNCTNRGSDWFEYSLNEYYREIRNQILPSGVSFEKSIGYHRLMVEFAVYPFATLQRMNYIIPLDIRFRLKKMFDFVLHYIKPDGTAPIIGDQDDGRFLPFGTDLNIDHRYLLTIGATIFQESEFKMPWEVEFVNSFFLLGNTCRDRYSALDFRHGPVESQAFEDAGFCVMRDKENYMFINNSGAAAYPEQVTIWGSHAHADLLSFELAIGNTSFLVDPGTYVYTSLPDERNRFRSTRMHNTIVVDQVDQHILSPKNVFRCLQIAEPVDFIFEVFPDREVFQGSHNGYMRFDEPVLHSRTIEFVKTKVRWKIVDVLSGKGLHNFKWYYHFDKGIDFNVENNRIYTLRNDGPNLVLTFSSEIRAEFQKLNDFVSKAYGKRSPSYTLEISVDAKCPVEATTEIELIK